MAIIGCNYLKLLKEESTKTDQEIWEAVKESITKWENIVNNRGEDGGGTDCALCSLFICGGPRLSCHYCPAEAVCGNEYAAWCEHQKKRHSHWMDAKKVYCPQCESLAKGVLRGLVNIEKEFGDRIEKKPNRLLIRGTVVSKDGKEYTLARRIINNLSEHPCMLIVDKAGNEVIESFASVKKTIYAASEKMLESAGYEIVHPIEFKELQWG